MRTLPANAYPCPAICKWTARIHESLDHTLTTFLLFFLSFVSFDLMTRYLGEGQQLKQAASGLDGTHFR